LLQLVIANVTPRQIGRQAISDDVDPRGGSCLSERVLTVARYRCGVSAPLAGITVVSVEQAVSVPFCSRQLADLGATVLKIERPDGGDFARHYDGNVGGQSAFFVWANRGKSSVALDLKGTEDRAQFEALLSGADVYLVNLSPDATVRAQLDIDSVRARHPHLIAGVISGYGDGGPRSTDKAYDLAIQAEAGVFDVTGDGEVQAKVGLSIADIAAGMYLLSGVLAALFRREQTGEGASINISMLEALTEWMQAPLLNANALGRTPARTARRHAQIAPYGTFRLADGTQILLAIQNNAEFQRFAELVLDDTEIATDSRFVTNADRIDNVDMLETLISNRFAAVPADLLRDRLRIADLAIANVNSLADVWNHEQLRARDRFVATTLPGGVTVETLRSPINIDNVPPPPPVVPDLGQSISVVEP
jgi:itaconate CoA-transferase